jgi:TfoX/Sxy family transcriptional regulator of competence genes
VAYDEELAERLRELTDAVPGLSEKKMFGGLAFLVHGNMAIAASGQGGLLVRVDPEESDALTAEPGVETMVMRGRAMAGWLRVDAARVESADALQAWADRGVGYASSLPPK